jgi:hypothetical protein
LAYAIVEIPPNATAFLVLTFLGGNLQFSFRLACKAIFLGIKNREVHPDDLGILVPFHPLSALVPSTDTAMRVEHKDGIVLNRVR